MVENIFDELQKYDFFAPFPEHLILEIAKIVTIQSFSPQFEILKQGQKNDVLYFIKKGRVAIIVENENIAEIGVGEIFGEMSIITHKLTSATVKAIEEVECYKIQIADIEKLPSDFRTHLLYLFYRVYCSVLATRIEATNQKAKKYEAANREIQKAQEELRQVNLHLEEIVAKRTVELEQQNEALLASISKVHELTLLRDNSLKKINELSEEHLKILKNSLSTLSLHASEEDREKIAEVTKSLDVVLFDMKPLNEMYSATQAMTSKKVLFIDNDKIQQMVAQSALGGTGVNLISAYTTDEVMNKIKSEKFDLIFVEAQSIELCETIANQQKNIPIVLITDKAVANYIHLLRAHPEIKNVISRHEEDRNFSVQNILTTVTKVLQKDYFGLEKYLAWGVNVQEFSIVDSETRKDLIEKMKDYFQSIGVRRTVLERMQISTEELLMNAIYDAPVNRAGIPIYNHLPRTTPVKLKEDQQGKLRFACDGVFLAVSVEDPFGMFPMRTIVDYLESCYAGKAGIYNTNKGGAGRGLHLMIENSDLTVFNVVKGIKTEVICAFNIDPQASKKHSNPSLHLFFH